MTRTEASELLLGAYGLRLTGVESAASLLVPALEDWPRIEVVRRVGRASYPDEGVGDDQAVLRLLDGGRIEIDRAEGRAEFTVSRRMSDAELVHPYLAPAAAVIGRWHGRESFHAGAFALADGVWALLGDRESGKSTTLAWLALQGHEIVCDDMLLLERTFALAGPRSVDLRPETARHLGVGEPLGVVGARERWRLTLGPVDSRLALHGWIFLEWGDRVEVVSMPPAERLARLVPHRALRLPPQDPDALLELTGLPGWTFRRPHGLGSVATAGRDLLEVLAG